MSFSSEIKDELVKLEDISPCCFHAQTYGMMIFSHFSGLNLSITTEHKGVFNLYVNSLKNYIGVKVNTGDGDSKKQTAYVKNDTDKAKVFDKFGHSISESSLRINHANFENECCVSAFLRGVFLSCGNISNPNTAYHLEFVVPFKKLSLDLMTVLKELDFEPKYIVRKGYHVVYFKDSECIEDLLAYMGAQQASLALMGVKIEKDIKNKVNRKLNFEMSNFEKVLSASNVQIDAIRYINSHGGTGLLPEKLRKLAEIRFDNPDASLSELQNMIDEEISRSGIKHRLDKIVEFAEKLKEK